MDSSLQFVLDTMGHGDSAEPDIRGGEGGGKTFDKGGQCYCVTRRELLALVRAINRNRYYLYGSMSFKEPEEQIACWVEELE